MDPYQTAAEKLHQAISRRHWDGQALTGPDPGIRFNYRIGRFVKSLFPEVDWQDRYYYLQGQGYWILGNWKLYQLTGDERYREIAVRCSDTMLSRQRSDGGWDYPNPEWRGRTATAEGTWGAIGLLETYRQTGLQDSLNGVRRWYRYLLDTVGFQRVGEELAVNYFAGRGNSRVPNNSAFVLRFLAELAQVTGEREFLETAPGMILFMQNAQKPTGEFPYSLGVSPDDPGRPHFQCYQYNAFECLDLIRYYELTHDTRALEMASRVAAYLSGGIAPDGHLYYDCENHHREVTYHAAAGAAALWKCAEVGIDGYQDLATRGYDYLLRRQLPDGAYSYSRQDYRVLSDRRSYPRYLAMILVHLLMRVPVSHGGEAVERSGIAEGG